MQGCAGPVYYNSVSESVNMLHTKMALQGSRIHHGRLRHLVGCTDRDMEIGSCTIRYAMAIYGSSVYSTLPIVYIYIYIYIYIYTASV